MNALVWIAIAALVIAGLASVGARCLRRASRAKLEELCRREGASPHGDEVALIRERIVSGVESLVVLASAFAVATGIGAALTNGAWSSESAWVAAVVWTVLGIGLLWFVMIWLPLAVARLWADAFVLRTWSLWRTVAIVLAPSVWAAQAISRLLERLSGRKPAHATEESLEEEILSIVSEGQREGLLEEDAREMIEGVIELGDVDVAEVMTPRTDMVSLHIELPWDEAVKKVSQSGHSRFPVYNRSPDDIVGILHVKELLVELAKPDESQRIGWPQLLRKPFFVPETKPVDDLLQEFQRSHNHIAVVLDEYGGVSGIVTIEDALEEIVGEIADEHDEALIDGIKTLDEHSAEALAKVRIHEINERLGLSLPENENYDTIGGFVFHELGRIPNVGEELTWHDVRIKVLDATRRRIDRVKIQVLSRPQPAV